METRARASAERAVNDMNYRRAIARAERAQSLQRLVESRREEAG